MHILCLLLSSVVASTATRAPCLVALCLQVVPALDKRQTEDHPVGGHDGEHDGGHDGDSG